MKLLTFDEIRKKYLSESGNESYFQLTEDEHKYIAIEYAKQVLEYAAEHADTKKEEAYTGGLDGSGNLYSDVEVVDRDSILSIKDKLK